MKQKIIFHIGEGKTGTSYLQSCFAKNQELFKRGGVLYPDSSDNKNAAEGKITSGNAFFIALFLNKEIVPQRPRPSKEAIVGFFSNAEFQKYESIVLSSEWLARFNVEEMKWLAALIKAKGYDIEIVYYVRSIADHAISAYSQIVKRHFYKHSCKHFIEKDYTPLFLQVIERLHAVFSKQEIRILNYDFLRKKIFPHFISEILTYKEPTVLDDFSNQQINRSLDMYELEICRHFNQTLSQDRHSTFISDALIYADQQKKATFVIEPEEIEILHKRFSHVISGVNQCLPSECHIAVVSKNLPVQKRQNIILSEYEKNLVNILSSLIKYNLK